MDLIINNTNFNELESEKFWSFPKNTKQNPKVEMKNMIFSLDYLGSKKIDGAYYRFIKDFEGNYVLQGRSRGVGGSFLNKINHVPHLHTFFDSLPNGTCLLGELYLPEKEGSSNVTTIMGCKEDKAILRQKDDKNKLHYYIFDVWAFDGKSMLDVTAAERFSLINSFYAEYVDSCIEFATYKEGKELWELLQKVLFSGGEGVVITKKNSTISPGARTARKTLKIKKELEETIDCFFTGKFTSPTREYKGKDIINWKYWENIQTGEKQEGLLYTEYYKGAPLEAVTKPYFYNFAGSLEIGLIKDNKVFPLGLLSGLPEEIKMNPLEYKNKVIEIMAMEILESKALRHAKMIKFRPDLTIEDCSYSKVFEKE